MAAFRQQAAVFVFPHYPNVFRNSPRCMWLIPLREEPVVHTSRLILFGTTNKHLCFCGFIKYD